MLVKYFFNNNGVRMNKNQAKYFWKSLSTIKEYKNTIEKINDTKLLDIDIAILIFIGSNNRLTLSRVIKHKYFSQYSLSTVKRSIARLICLKLIEQGEWKLDSRKKLLSVNFELLNFEDLL
jgi:hypothetical protein